MPTLKLLAPLCAAILPVAACASTVAEDKPAKGAGDPKVLAARNNQFGFELMGKLHEEGKNLFISPLSISAALQMTAGGAQGETRDEMAKAMHVDDLKLSEHNKALLDALNSRKDFKLSVANSLWSDKARDAQRRIRQRMPRLLLGRCAHAEFQRQVFCENDQ